jgi:hypothetical protein
MKMISCRGATPDASYSSLNGRLFPCASKMSRSSTFLRSFSLGRSLLTSTVPSNSSCSFCSTGVSLAGEKGGVLLSCASIEGLGSVSRPDESGGEGGAAELSGAGADVGGRALSLVSMVAILRTSIARSACKSAFFARVRKGGLAFTEAKLSGAKAREDDRCGMWLSSQTRTNLYELTAKSRKVRVVCSQQIGGCTSETVVKGQT